MAKKNQKTVAINTVNVNNKEENMKKNTTGASVIMTKRGTGTITLSQPISHGPIYLTVFNVTSEIKGDVSSKIKEFQAAGFEISKMTHHSEEVAASPKKPTSEKVVKTRAEALTERYGDLDTRRAYAQKRSAIWNEESAKIAEEVKKTGKRLRKAEWKKLMTERVNARMAEAV